jgi:dTDP-4-amino-4,6-dideoxygalactose transaminase
VIPVTKPFLPPKEEYDIFLQGIWQRNILTNRGPLALELEEKLQEYLGVDNLLLLSNGTIAIQIALKALGVTKQVITTPFSYIATTSSIVWEGCEPVFADIDPDTLNIDPVKIEELITPNTRAILATHCFGNSCDIDAIEKVARQHSLKVIYDAAHCFGTLYKGKSVFNYGDVSTTSFHATKLFHTIEGGAVFAKDTGLIRRMAYMRNFGHDGPEKFNGVGINGKNSEMHAAMGLCNLKYVDEILSTRKKQSLYYDELLKSLCIQGLKVQDGCIFNYAYYPIVFETEKITLEAKAALEKDEIFPRRYFYPSLSTLNYVKRNPTPLSDSISSRILCLPLFHDMGAGDQQLIASVIRETLHE